jgi:hypothetical protein
MLRFFVVPLILVSASLGIFAGLGSLIAQGDMKSTDLVDRIALGGKNERWQAAMELSNRVAAGEVDLLQDEALVTAIGEAFVRARAEGDDPRILRYLSRFLARSPNPAVSSALEDALADDHPDVRMYTVEALAQHGGPSTLGSLIPRLDDNDAGVRTVAAWAVSVVGDRAEGHLRVQAGDALRRSLHDPSGDVQWNAALGLARMKEPGGEDQLWALIQPSYVRSRIALPEADLGVLFSTTGSDPASPEELEAQVLRNALSAVYRLEDRSMLDGVRSLANDHRDPGVRDFAMKTRDALEKVVAARGAVPQRTWTASTSSTVDAPTTGSKE